MNWGDIKFNHTSTYPPPPQKKNVGFNRVSWFPLLLCLSVLWAVVNNAGVAVYCEIEWCSVQEFQKIMDVNVFGIVRVTKGFLPLLRQSEGRVINVASLAGKFLCCSPLPSFSKPFYYCVILSLSTLIPFFFSYRPLCLFLSSFGFIERSS